MKPPRVLDISNHGRYPVETGQLRIIFAALRIHDATETLRKAYSFEALFLRPSTTSAHTVVRNVITISSDVESKSSLARANCDIARD